MGQRLVVNIQRDEKTIGNIYYHWSAYTLSALEEMFKVIDYINHNREIENHDDIEFLTNIATFLNKAGGGLDSESYAIIEKERPWLTPVLAKDRNEGIVSFDKEKMHTRECDAEAITNIDFTEKIIGINEVIYSYYFSTFKEDYLEEMLEMTEEEIESLDLENNLPVLEYDLTRIPFLEIEDLYKKLKEVDEKGDETSIKAFMLVDDEDGVYVISE